jgi:predicted MPP superfamily phosphohydrolase
VGSGLAIFLVIGGIIVYGSWNARQVGTTGYNLNIGKSAGEIKQLHVVMVSDIHLGAVVDRPRLKAMVDRINLLNPDLVLLAGDTIDDDIKPFVDEQMGRELQRLKPRLGVYAIMGNHEYIGGNAEEFAKQLENSGIKVLRDKYIKIENSFYLVGREDRSMERFNGKNRKNLKQLLKGLDARLPVILLDHQPSNLEEPQKQGVDVQLSGHTHEGQVWPAHLITGRIFETDWGYLRKGNLQVIVSSGVGTWGPPIRVGNHPEIVDIKLKFGTR